VTRPPTLDQLRNLADRAERGPLTPAEAGRLREGLDRIDAKLRTNRGASWGGRVRGLRRKLHTLHAPMICGGIQICAHCSGWNGTRCQGLVTEWPCDTLTALDHTFPAQEAAA
jgi:hypothetical protein